MRKRTIFLLALATVFAALVGGVLGVLVIVMLNPGNKGPHVSDDAVTAAFFAGAAVGVSAVVIVVRRVAARRRPAWLDEGR